MVIDVAKCEDCNNCFLACKDEHVDNEWPGYATAQPRHGQRWMDIARKERGAYPLIDVAYRPTPCMHCRNAPCLDKSADGAVYRRTDGIVMVDPEKAKSQKQIAGSCPYGAIFWNREIELAQKCTFCAHLLDQGWETPRCVQACPTEALTVVKTTLDTFRSRIASENLEALHPEYNTQPRVYYKNLYRFNRCFIGGSAAFQQNGVTDCAAGAVVTLYKGDRQLGQIITDAFGDFRFDRLSPDSGLYRLEIRHPHRRSKSIEVELTASVGLGVINLE